MIDRVFVDSNIFIYAFDVEEGRKHERARDGVARLWSGRQGALSTQVLQELCVNFRRKMRTPPSPAQARTIIRNLMAWKVVINTGESVLATLDLQERQQLSFWDAMIVQAAVTAGASTLWSEDFTHGREIEGVRIVNPLLEDSLPEP